MTTALKILNPVLVDRAMNCFYIDMDGAVCEKWNVKGIGKRAAESGQRWKDGIAPDKAGAWEVEDIPTPEPLPTLTVWRYPFGWSTATHLAVPRIATLTVTFDPDGTPHVDLVREVGQ